MLPWTLLYGVWKLFLFTNVHTSVKREIWYEQKNWWDCVTSKETPIQIEIEQLDNPVSDQNEAVVSEENRIIIKQEAR